MGGRRLHVGLIVSMVISLMAAVSIRAQDVCAAGCGIPDTDILAYPLPNVTQIYPDDQQLNDRRYQKVLNAINIYDAPNGNIVAGLDAGFNYITVNGSAEGWTEIEQGRWVENSNLRDVQPSRFAGVSLSADLPYPIAWILVTVVPSPSPGVLPPEGGIALQRYTVVNIYSTVNVSGWDWYQVGVGQWVEQRNIARVMPVERPAGVDTDKWVAVDLYEQVAVAYEGTTPVFATLVSSGLKDWPTNEGLFHVYVRYPRALMEGAHGKPDFYSLQEVPWTQYFDNDIGLHGTYWHDGFGYRHSHGCVNLSITDAQWLYNWASSEIDLTVSNDKGAAVYVYSSGTYVNG